MSNYFGRSILEYFDFDTLVNQPPERDVRAMEAQTLDYG